MITVDEYIKSLKSVLRKINTLESRFNSAEEDMQIELADQLSWLVDNMLNFLLKCTTKKQALQITACSKRFNEHRELFTRLGVSIP